MNTLLKNILHIETCSGEETTMRNFIVEHCQKSGFDVSTDEFGNVYVTKGKADSFPCYVAHLDTVHPISGDGIALVSLGDNVTGFNPVTMRQTGIGGDDKCGIYCALRCLEELPACKAVFFSDEETGCHGSGDCDLSFFADCRFVVSADRRGNDDFVTDISGPLSSKQFLADVKPILKKYGFKHSTGAMADVMELRNRDVGVSVANISAGYYNPHQDAEFINLPDLENGLSLMLAMGKEMKDVYPFKREKVKQATKQHTGKEWSADSKVNDFDEWTPRACRIIDRQDYYRNGFTDDEIDEMIRHGL